MIKQIGLILLGVLLGFSFVAVGVEVTSLSLSEDKGGWQQIMVNSVEYRQDARTGLCFAVASRRLSNVSCEKVAHLLPKPGK